MRGITSAVAFAAVAAAVVTGPNAFAQEEITPEFGIAPNVLQRGQHFEVQIEKDDCAKGGRVVSTGFRGPLPAGDLHGIAVDEPGRYTAQLFCADHAYAGSAGFEVLAAPPDPRT